MGSRQDRARRRRCLGCGFDGPELQGEKGRFVFVCPGCGCDLYARPALSYAEMEGLVVRRRGLIARCLRLLGLTESVAANPVPACSVEPRPVQLERL